MMVVFVDRCRCGSCVAETVLALNNSVVPQVLVETARSFCRSKDGSCLLADLACSSVQEIYDLFRGGDSVCWVCGPVLGTCG